VNEPVRIAEGVHRCGTDLVNWYLVEEGGRVTIVDCGAPGYWPQLDPSLEAIGRARSDVDAVVLTHGDSDHVGFSERLRSEAGVTVWAPEGDAKLVREGKVKKTEGSPLPYLRYPFAYRLLFHLVRNGGAKVPAVANLSTYDGGQRLEVPGNPVAVHTPGHTRGHCVLQFGDVLLAGDAICTLNPLTGRRGPQVMPKAFDTDSAEALASIDLLPEASVIGVGHGDPWTEGTAAAKDRAREAGPT